MENIVEQIGNDPVLMIGAAIGVVLILFVVLVVIVASMRIKTYKDRFVATKIDNEEKEKRIVSLQEELQTIRIKNAQNEQELLRFDETKKRLSHTEESLQKTQQELSKTQSSLAQTQAQLESLQAQHRALEEAHEGLKLRFEDISDENNKLRVNNARLLMKLETEERFSQQERRGE